MADDIDDWRRAIVARYGLPLLIVAFFLQPDLADVSRGERMALSLLLVGTLFVLENAFTFIPSYWGRQLALVVTIYCCGLAWDKVMLDNNKSDIANDRRCLAIQHDMLSARPRRTDGPDLFQALGCRPQGEGSVYAPLSAARSRH